MLIHRLAMPGKPRVALVHDHLVQDGGAERVLRTFMKIWPDAPIYTLLYDPAAMGPDFADAEIRTSVLQRLLGPTKRYKALLPVIDAAFRRFDLSGYDLVVSSASGFAKSVRTGPGTLHVCYCHTPIRYLWSDSERYISELPYPAPVKAAIRLDRPRLRRADLRAAKGVDAFVANSRYVAERITKYYGRDSTVINPPVDIGQFAPLESPAPPPSHPPSTPPARLVPSAHPGAYYLIATRLEPYKRVDQVIEAFNTLGLPLKVMGSGTDAGRLQRLAGPNIAFTGRVSDAERRRLFAEATAMLNPQEEDFGITAVEALASGTPVIAYAAGGAAEILEHGVTGWLFGQQSAEAIAGAVQSYDPTIFDPAVLRARAEEFSEPHFIGRMRAFTEQTYERFRAGQNVGGQHAGSGPDAS